MNEILYVIHRYVKGEIASPLGFFDKDAAYKKFEELSNELHQTANNEDGSDEWEELGGKEIACMSVDTIYRLCAHQITNRVSDTFAYTEYQDGKYYQLRDVGVSTYGALRRELKGFIEEYGRDERFELVDSGVDFAKFATDGLEYINEAYVQEIEFCY